MKLEQIIKDYFEDEGWHRIYKKYGSKILAKENYRWKRKIMKRFGPSRKGLLRQNILDSSPLWESIKTNPCTELRIPLIAYCVHCKPVGYKGSPILQGKCGRCHFRERGK